MRWRLLTVHIDLINIEDMTFIDSVEIERGVMQLLDHLRLKINFDIGCSTKSSPPMDAVNPTCVEACADAASWTLLQAAPRTPSTGHQQNCLPTTTTASHHNHTIRPSEFICLQTTTLPTVSYSKCGYLSFRLVCLQSTAIGETHALTEFGCWCFSCCCLYIGVIPSSASGFILILVGLS